MLRTSASVDCPADSGGGILSWDFVPQGRAFAFVGAFLCHDDERFGFGDPAGVGCGVFAAAEGSPIIWQVGDSCRLKPSWKQCRLLAFMDGLDYTTIIELAEPLAGRRGSGLERYTVSIKTVAEEEMRASRGFLLRQATEDRSQMAVVVWAGDPGRRSQTHLPWATFGHPYGVLFGC